MNLQEQAAFSLILKSGDARSLGYEAFEFAMAGDFAAAKQKLQEAEEQLSEAHKAQVELIQKEAQGEGVPPNLVLIHAQDHLMTAMAELNLLERIIRVLEVKQ